MPQFRPAAAAEAPFQGVDGGPTFTVQDETSLLRQVLRQITSAQDGTKKRILEKSPNSACM
jgi:hypothetical protein